MLGSWKIARLFGIDIRLHWTFFLLVLLVVQMQAEPTAGLLVLFTAFGSVLLHELGHSLTAKRFGIHVLDITFWPLGGMARMSEIPEEPRVEGWVAIAGPAVNFALVAIGAPVLLLSGLGDGPGWLTEAAGMFVLINVMLGTFNLVPAFPMDGGRILRALLARKMNYLRATEIAVKTGRVVAMGMIALSLVLFVFGGQMMCAIPLIAAFVWFAGGRELLAVRMRHGRSPFGGAPLADLFAQAFARNAEQAQDSRDADAEVRQPTPGEVTVETDGPRRPADWAPEVERQSGFSEETLRRLERYPGRLPRRRDQEPWDEE